MSNIQTLRQTAIQELDTISAKQRFGYFSIPASLAIGDSRFQGKSVQKDENGRVATQPRNISVKPTASGQTKSSYFSLQKSIYEGDLYMDPGKHDRLDNLKEQAKLKEKEVYKPVNGVIKSLAISSYLHMPCDNNQRDPKAKRNKDGFVITEPKNVTTNPPSKVVKELFKPPKYESSPFDAEHQMTLKQIEKHRSKLPESTFSAISPGDKPFSKNIEIYGCDKVLPQKKLTDFHLNIMDHDSKFKPSNPNKSGKFGTIGKYPQHICQPPKQLKRKVDNGDDKKDSFKLRNPEKLSAPTPSITLNPMNLRKHIR